MAKQLGPIDLNGWEIRNGVLQVLAAPPSSPKQGQSYYDSTLNAPQWYTGSAWINPLARANHTGTQLAATISDLTAAVRANTLDTFAAPAADVAFNAKKITGLADPINPQDGATRGWTLGQLDARAQGISGKGSVVAAATSNVASLAGLAQTIDGVPINVDGMRVLLVAQTTASQNGPWVAHSGAWTRPTTDGAQAELETGAFWFVEPGGSNGATQWWITSPAAGVAITPGTTAIGIVKFNAAQSYTASLGVKLVGNDIEANLLAAGGLALTGSALGVDTALVMRKFAATVGDGSAINVPVTHNLGTKDVHVTVRDAATDARVDCDWTATSTTVVTLNPASAPALNSLRVLVSG